MRRSSASSSSCRSSSVWRALFGLYTIVQERQCKVYVLFGKVIGQCSTSPACTSCWPKLGPRPSIVNWLGRCYTLDMRLDQKYLRSQPVNSEEGRADGHRHLVRDVHQRSRRLSLQERRPARLAGRQREQRHRALPEQPEAGRHAREPPRHEPDRARAKSARNPRNGATSSARSTSARFTSATRA